MPQPDPATERLFDALGDATRRRIIDRLAAAPASVSALAAPLGITLTAVVQHLRVLEEAGLVATEKVGRVRTARLADEGLCAVRDWAHSRRAQWARRLDQLAEMLEPPAA